MAGSRPPAQPAARESLAPCRLVHTHTHTHHSYLHLRGLRPALWFLNSFGDGLPIFSAHRIPFSSHAPALTRPTHTHAAPPPRPEAPLLTAPRPVMPATTFTALGHFVDPVGGPITTPSHMDNMFKGQHGAPDASRKRKEAPVEEVRASVCVCVCVAVPLSH